METSPTFKLGSLVQALEQEQELISAQRRQELSKLTQHIRESLATFGYAKIIVICTHNSRRSQLAQLWLKAAALHFGGQGIYTYSGGTESTAFNHRMVAALGRAGFPVRKLKAGENPKYHIKLGAEDTSCEVYYSKKYDESYNPQKNFIAVMVCSQADEGCPFVPGVFKRFSLPYQDPKDFDDTDREAPAYDEKVREIGREMVFVVKGLK